MPREEGKLMRAETLRNGKASPQGEIVIVDLSPPNNMLIFRHRDELIFQPGILEIDKAPDVIGAKVIGPGAILCLGHDRTGIPIGELQSIPLLA